MAAPVLGIDAAWTPNGSSGIAFVVPQGRGWRCAHVSSFVAPTGSPTDSPLIRSLLRSRAGRPAVVAIDIPLSRKSITGRRQADDCVSKEYGGRKCAVHSPTATRPGAISLRTVRGWEADGYQLATTDRAVGSALIEVYPHTGLLSLLKCKERFPYKVARARTFWKGDTHVRTGRLLMAFRQILDALERDIEGIDITLPNASQTSTRELKEVEDQLDALVCAWTAIQHIKGRTSALGDASAAIWVPTDSLRSDDDRQGCLASARA